MNGKTRLPKTKCGGKGRNPSSGSEAASAGTKYIQIAEILEVHRGTVSVWLKLYNQEYPKIWSLAKSEDAETRWVDEDGIKSHDQRGRGYVPKGKTPVRLHEPRVKRISKIGSVTNQGKLRFMCYVGSNFTLKNQHVYRNCRRNRPCRIV